MRSKKFILLVVLFLLLLSQIPFAYRRFKLRRLSNAIQQLNSQRTPTQPNGFKEYKGVVHVHSFLGGHSAGTFSEIISAAQANQLQFVIMTEHTEKEFDTAAMTLKGIHGGVLFINGNEVNAENGDRLLVLPGEVSIVAYPNEFKTWDATRDKGVGGVEVYNVFTNAKQANPVIAFFDVLWSQRAYPELIFAHYFQRPDESLKKWDQALTRTRLTATGGNDAHANIGVSLNDSSGKKLLGIQLDPYAVSFRLVRLHVLIEETKPLDEKGLMEAIRAGHCFIGFDFLGDSSGFAFETAGGKIQGDEISLQADTKLRFRSPVPARMVIFKDGSIFLEDNGITSKEIPIKDRGVYRAEIYLPQLGNRPWIISNPIYVR